METTAQTNRLVLERDRDDSRLSWRRRQVLTAAGVARPGVALEVGAFDNPTLRTRDSLDVRYVDYFSADELRRKYADHPRRDISRIVDVDYVVKGPRLSPFIHDKVDLFVANHVIEHICNPIDWLCDVASFCNAGASMFMAVPDQCFTFDYLKQPTDITDLVRAWEQGKQQPDAYDVARMHYLRTRVDAQALWDGQPGPQKPERTGVSYREQLDRARKQVREGYTDVHCTFFTAESFLHIFTELRRSGFIPWRVQLLRNVERGGNEFYVLLTLDGDDLAGCALPPATTAAGAT